MKKISDDCWQSFFINTFSTLYNYFDYAVQKSPEYMEGLFFWVLHRLVDHGGGGGGGLVLLSFYTCHLYVSLIVTILNFC